MENPHEIAEKISEISTQIKALTPLTAPTLPLCAVWREAYGKTDRITLAMPDGRLFYRIVQSGAEAIRTSAKWERTATMPTKAVYIGAMRQPAPDCLK